MVALVAGCASPAAPAPAPAEPAPYPAPEGFGDVEIWYYWETPGHQVALGELIAEYNANNPGTTVSANYVPFADFKKQLSLGASADILPDLVIIDSPDHASYSIMGIFEDITGKFDVSQYFEGPINSATLDGALYGMPFGINCLALYYNTDMLSAAGVTPPTTWAELKDAAKALTSGNVYGLGSRR